MKNRRLNLVLSAALSMLMLWGCKQSKELVITSYGAVADGKTMNTKFIQQAIDEASQRGGGKVVVPSGKFLTGVLTLKSNVELFLAEKAELLGSAKRIDYGPKDASPLIVANNAKNISITGKGTIDGQGNELLKDIYVMLNAGTLEDKEWKEFNPWHQMRPEERNRPKLIEFINCDSIKISGISIKNGLCWVQNYKECKNLLIEKIKVESNIFWNNDGIDVTDCKNVRILNCDINADDDGICLKSSNRNSCCENVEIANCRVRSSASAIKFGTASHGGFKKISVHDITVYDTYRSAIAIEAVDGGAIEDVDVRNIKATNTGNAILVRLGHRNKDSVYSTLKKVYIGNVDVVVPKTKPDKGYPMEGPVLGAPHNIMPSSITGIPGHRVQDVTLENITIRYPGGADKKVACFALDTLSRMPEKIPNYPEFTMFGEMPAWGFFIRHAEGVTFKNVNLLANEEEFRSTVIVMESSEVTFENSSFQLTSKNNTVVLKDAKNISLKNVKDLPNKEIKEAGFDKF